MSLESPNQVGHKGNHGSAPSGQGGKLISPNQTGTKGDKSPSGDGAPGGRLESPGRTNASEAKNHDNGR